MIIQLTNFDNLKPVYFETSNFVAMHEVGTDKPHTYIIMTNGSLQVKESLEDILRMVNGIAIYAEIPTWDTDEHILNQLKHYRNLNEIHNVYFLVVKKAYK